MLYEVFLMLRAFSEKLDKVSSEFHVKHNLYRVDMNEY